ncbi:DUF2007-related protein [uncultured Zobellia sp.]|uniref:DUF2007-related protein n=1 Tax=uncultured Zobellia sp. TaxID=255433 RepID=UPI00259A953C|nr:DUF2007-related protein [uncultured Zobellia sp.]
MDTKNNIKSVEIFSGTQWEATMIKNLLANEQIESYLKDEIMAGLNTFSSLPGGSIQVKVMISNIDFEKSVSVIKEYQKNSKEEK